MLNKMWYMNGRANCQEPVNHVALSILFAVQKRRPEKNLNVSLQIG